MSNIQTLRFRTRSIFEPRKNYELDPDKWKVAIDIGYSGTKIYSPNIIACFPSFATKIDGKILNTSVQEKDAIFYKDLKTNDTWEVGRIAQNSINESSTDENSMAIYGRKRYFDPMFTVIVRTAIGVACMKNDFGDPFGKQLIIQTGLPNMYLKSDRPLIREVFSGEHSFAIRIGNEKWQNFNLNLPEGNVFVMQQPLGTLLSVSMNDDGSFADEYEAYYNSNVLICDPGFGTMDCFTINNGVISNDGVQTMNAFTMKEVLTRTSNIILKKYGKEIPIPTMQKNLEKGTFTKLDRKSRVAQEIEFYDILSECNKNVAEDALDKLFNLYGDLIDYKYLILTGGTGEAWYPYFKEGLSGLSELRLIPGNQHAGALKEDVDLPFIFSNVRGYYFYVQKNH